MTDLMKISQQLEDGAIGILPTETVYGLAASANHDRAIERIYEIKGRDFNKPLAVCVSSLEQAQTLAEFSPLAQKLAQRFWPGPLTLVLPRKAAQLNEKCYQGDTIALRCPDITWRGDLCRTPLALTSANLSGQADAVTAQTSLNDEVDFVVDDGPSRNSVPSTILAVKNRGVKILRKGVLCQKDFAGFQINWV